MAAPLAPRPQSVLPGDWELRFLSLAQNIKVGQAVGDRSESSEATGETFSAVLSKWDRRWFRHGVSGRRGLLVPCSHGPGFAHTSGRKPLASNRERSIRERGFEVPRLLPRMPASLAQGHLRTASLVNSRRGRKDSVPSSLPRVSPSPETSPATWDSFFGTAEKGPGQQQLQETRSPATVPARPLGRAPRRAGSWPRTSHRLPERAGRHRGARGRFRTRGAPGEAARSQGERPGTGGSQSRRREPTVCPPRPGAGACLSFRAARPLAALCSGGSSGRDVSLQARRAGSGVACQVSPLSPLPRCSFSADTGRSEMVTRGRATAAPRAPLAGVGAPRSFLVTKEPGGEGRPARAACKARVLQNTVKLPQTNCAHDHA